MAYLELDGISKRFGEASVLESLQLELAEGEVLALLGRSGSGKTTALRILAGFETPDAGRIRVGGEDVTALAPARRGFGMVFQHYALFPHMTVGENVAFGLETRRLSRERIAARTAEALALVDLPGFAARRVGEISGGQQQRVALARALAPEPRVLLLDEPLSNLDPELRERTRHELRAAVKRVGITTVLVTHEQEEAFDVGDRVAVLHRGRLEQVGTPEELYRAPATRFVATFVGRAGVVPVTAPASLGGRDAEVLVARNVAWRATPADGVRPGAAAELVVRPESLRLVEPEAPRAVAGRVLARRYGGPSTLLRVGLAGGGEVEVRLDGAAAPEVGAAVAVAPREEGPTPRLFSPEGGG